MSKKQAVRLVLLCEDRAHEDFVRGLLPQPSFRMMYVVKGPNQAGVIAKYPAEVRTLRSKKNQAQLGLVVMIDGDNVGRRARLVTFDDKLAEAKALDPKHQGKRQVDEPIAVLVPTRNIETWIVGLLGHDTALDEATDYKGHPSNDSRSANDAGRTLRALDRAHADTAALFAALPALAEVDAEIARLPQ